MVNNVSPRPSALRLRKVVPPSFEGRRKVEGRGMVEENLELD